MSSKNHVLAKKKKQNKTKQNTSSERACGFSLIFVAVQRVFPVGSF